MVKLGEVAKVISGGTPKTSVSEYWDGDVPWLTPKDLSGNTGLWIRGGARFITDLGLVKSSAVLLPKGTVLWSSRAPIGLVAIADIPVSTNQGFKSFIPSKTLDSDYLAYWLIANRSALQALGVGVTFKEVSGKRAAEIQIPLPPLNEQKRIAEILGGVAFTVELISKQIDAIDRCLKAELWDSTDEGELVSISHYIQKITSGKSLKEGDPDDFRNAVLKISAVTSGYFDETEIKPLPNSYIPPVSHRANVGDILFSRANTTELVGASALVETSKTRACCEILVCGYGGCVVKA